MCHGWMGPYIVFRNIYLTTLVKEPVRTKDLTETNEAFVIELTKKFVQLFPYTVVEKP